MSIVHTLAATRGLGPFFATLRNREASYALHNHWKQGEFHHDLVLEVADPELPGPFLVVSTNCNGGIKAIDCFGERPTRGAIWAARCPDNEAFSGELPALLDRARTVHYFDPCEVLRPDARSELRPSQRKRQHGGGWLPIDAEDDWFG